MPLQIYRTLTRKRIQILAPRSRCAAHRAGGVAIYREKNHTTGVRCATLRVCKSLPPAAVPTVAPLSLRATAYRGESRAINAESGECLDCHTVRHAPQSNHKGSLRNTDASSYTDARRCICISGTHERYIHRQTFRLASFTVAVIRILNNPQTDIYNSQLLWKVLFSKLKQHYVNRRFFFSDPFEIEMILITTRNSCMSDLAVACIAALIYVWIWIKWNWLRKQLGDLRGGRRTLEHRCNIDIRFCINM